MNKNDPINKAQDKEIETEEQLENADLFTDWSNIDDHFELTTRLDIK